MSEVYHPIALDVSEFPANVITGLQKTHPQLEVHENLLHGNASVTPDLIQADLDFWKKYPNMPVENVGCRLETYVPQNESQERLLKAARFLTDAGNQANFMGLMVFGGPGLGKTHIAFSIAKAMDAKGDLIDYVHLPSVKYNKTSECNTVILDDANSSYERANYMLPSIITRMHQNGFGRLFVTSNLKSMDALVRPMFPTAEAYSRIKDRAANALFELQLDGESYRSRTTHNPWADFS